MQSTLYSFHELITAPLGVYASIPALPLVRYHQMYSFKHFYERDEKDMLKTNLVHQRKIWHPSCQHYQVCLFICVIVY